MTEGTGRYFDRATFTVELVTDQIAPPDEILLLDLSGTVIDDASARRELERALQEGDEQRLPYFLEVRDGTTSWGAFAAGLDVAIAVGSAVLTEAGRAALGAALRAIRDDAHRRSARVFQSIPLEQDEAIERARWIVEAHARPPVTAAELEPIGIERRLEPPTWTVCLRDGQGVSYEVELEESDGLVAYTRIRLERP
jgi:hypothetical protein